MTRPLQIYLEDADFERLDKWASERGCSKSQAMRIALRALTRTPEEDPLLSASGMIDGLPHDLSEYVDRYLQETFINNEVCSTHYPVSRSGILRAFSRR
jgi:hypothetical protein